jgi:hypothetical protein
MAATPTTPRPGHAPLRRSSATARVRPRDASPGHIESVARASSVSFERVALRVLYLAAAFVWLVWVPLAVYVALR